MEPRMNAGERRFYDISHRIVGRGFAVSNTLGAGFLEKVYQNALAHEMTKAGLPVARQHPIEVKYDGVTVGKYVADLLVEQSVLIEVKAVTALDNIHDAQCLNYLKATGLKLCLPMNFGHPRMEHRRLVNQF